MSNKVIISVVAVLVMLLAIGGGTYLVLNRQNLFSQAQQTSNTTSNTTNQGASCPAPGTPSTVTLSYPLCESTTPGGTEQCQFDKAGCVWEAVSGATKYSVKVTEVETGANVATQSINAPTVKTSFPVVQGRTYKCEVSAVNSCGTTGGTNEDTLLCEADGFFSPTPAPTAAPPPPPPAPVSTPTPTPLPTPTPTPTPEPLACGVQGCSTSIPCQTGFICVETSVGVNYCAKADYQSQCYRSPNNPSCCQAPAPKPTLPPAGVLDQTLIIGGVGVGLVILGAAALLLL